MAASAAVARMPHCHRTCALWLDSATENSGHVEPRRVIIVEGILVLAEVELRKRIDIKLFVDTPWYVTQPLRIPFDFSPSDAALMRWAEESARKLPGFQPVAEWEREMTTRMGLA